MSEKTHISWADSTWSPWDGCRRVSEGCDLCYIVFTPPLRIAGIKHGSERLYKSESYWAKPLAWNEKARRSGNPLKVFPSLCDWLDKEVPIQNLVRFLELIGITPHLRWQLLTKRTELFEPRMIEAMKHIENSGGSGALHAFILNWVNGVPPVNVWMGASCENQKWADIRIPQLLAISAHRRFLSCEPLLGPIDLSMELRKGIHQVIWGGESTQGKPARPCNVEWLRDGVKQCRAAGVACWVKQLGSRPFQDGILPSGDLYMKALDRQLKHKSGTDMAEWPEDMRIQEAMP